MNVCIFTDKSNQLWCKVSKRRNKTLIFLASVSVAAILLMLHWPRVFTDKNNQGWWLKVSLRRNKILIFLAFVVVAAILLTLHWPQKQESMVLKKPPFPGNVFLLETSGASKLNPRQACAVESAARHHLDSVVTVYLFTSDQFDDSFHLSSSLTNLHVTSINKDTLFANSTLWDWYQKGDWRDSSYRINDISDASRLLLVWKHGGLYLDLDFVVLRSLYGARNSLFRQRESSISNAVFGFDRHHPFILRCLEGFKTHYKKNKWGSGGPLVLTETFKSECRLGDLKDGVHPQCKLRLFPPVVAYPVIYQEWKDFFEAHAKNRVQNLSVSSYLMHVWNFLSRNTYLSLDSGTAYEDAIRKECPTVYRSLVKSTKLNSSFVF